MLAVKVHNVPEGVKWIVAQRDKYNAELYYYDSRETEEEAYDLAQELDDGVVVEVIE